MAWQSAAVIATLLCALCVVDAHWIRKETDAGIKAHGMPNGWEKVSVAPRDESIELVFAVKQTNKDRLEQLLLVVSDPESESYGDHLSHDEVNDLVAPAPVSIEAVADYLSEHGVDDWTSTVNGDFITAVVPVAKAEAMLRTTYNLYQTKDKRMTAVRCEHYSLPSAVAEHVDFVGGTVRFPVVQRRREGFSGLLRQLDDGKDAPGSPDALIVDPAFLRSLYQVGDAHSKATSNKQAVASFLEQYFSPSDLQEFFKLFQNSSVGHTVEKVIGPNGVIPGTEAELDVQYIMSVGEGVRTWVWYTPGRAPTNPNNEPFLAWLVNVSATADAPWVHSVSYGEDEKSVGLDYASRINTEFQKLGVRGISVLIASGDSGVGGNCTAGGRFTPNFPTGSPWVTSVGGVIGGTPGQFPTGEVTDSISGGGFSDWWDRPSYQSAAVLKYLANTSGLPVASRWNHSGRGYPDIAAQSEGFVVVQFGVPMPFVGGTSCATPTASGIISLLNDLRLQNGLPTLGFLNPFLYGPALKSGTSFSDVTEGYNMGCTDGVGFPARAGWDPATGLGTLNYAGLAKVVVNV